ncbi:MAG TPA: hypothetical protein PKV50_06535 [Prolixibacteraceae bacterium]|jgi:hypothetical protein|nr:hypothetical protein [Bacteroidales bacterium]HQN94417.1 hypothetical protein [Prolixibacteraceae bacterium]HUM89169.1 hypothetical protein [Prolixibacteraceae bacterium]
MKKVTLFGVIILVIALTVFVYIRYFFVFGEGVKAGDLNFIVYKGMVFKTWEGRVIQTGIRTNTPGAIQSNEFEFSVKNDSIAKVLEVNSGRFVELRYKEYFHSLPWRGNSKYVVHEIISIGDSKMP